MIYFHIFNSNLFVCYVVLLSVPDHLDASVSSLTVLLLLLVFCFNYFA